MITGFRLNSRLPVILLYRRVHRQASVALFVSYLEALLMLIEGTTMSTCSWVNLLSGTGIGWMGAAG